MLVDDNVVVKTCRSTKSNYNEQLKQHRLAVWAIERVNWIPVSERRFNGNEVAAKSRGRLKRVTVCQDFDLLEQGQSNKRCSKEKVEESTQGEQGVHK